MAASFKVGRVPEGHALWRAGYEYVAVCGRKSCRYYSAGWPSKKQAQLRGEQHANEHDTGELMPPKEEVEVLTPHMFGRGTDPGVAPVTPGDELWKTVS